MSPRRCRAMRIIGQVLHVTGHDKNGPEPASGNRRRPRGSTILPRHASHHYEPTLQPKPRILFVTRYIDHILYFFLQQLASRAELSIVVELPNEWTTLLEDDGYRITQLDISSRFDKKFQQALSDLGAGHDWDLIQSFHGNSQLSNLIRWNRGRVPLVAYRARIGHLKFRENPLAFWSARNPSLAAVSAVSTEVKRYLESFLLLRARNVHVTPHGINQAWVDKECAATYGLRQKLGIDADALIVASLASLRPVKRFDYIVHAATKLQSLPIHFVHVGDPRGWDAKAAHLPKIHFLGHDAMPLPILADADVFAMTSHNEAFGRANLEAMACGLPVIGSNTGGLLDLVRPGYNGELFATESRDAFADIVAAYCKDRARVSEHGLNSRRRVAEEFATEHMVENYLRLYRSVIAR